MHSFFRASLRLVIGLFLLGFGLISLKAADAPLRIGIIGDSTVCAYTEEAPQRGWGQRLPEFFKPGTLFMNQAQGGCSTKTFPAARWNAILKFKPDFVLIQFGHNDSHAKDRPESTDAPTDFKEYLKRYIQNARANQITPILVTPMHRRLFTPSGQPTTELEPYAQAMREVATELNVKLVDLSKSSGELFAKLGDAGSTDLTVGKIDAADRPGQDDRTHFTEKGARAMAGLIAEELRALDEKLRAAM